MSFARSTSPARLRARTRAALGQLVGSALSAPLDALENRLSRHWPGPGSRTQAAPARRLREVLDRDRALAAAQPAALLSAQDLSPIAPEAAASTESGSAAAQPPVAPPVLAPESGAQEVAEEPIRTRTMARLLAAQGYRARALAIYQALLSARPDDAELRAEAERLRAEPA